MIDSVPIALDSSRPWEVSGQCVLALFDVHQRINWADAVLEHEKGVYDHVVFGGDVMDSFAEPPAVAGARETARWYARLLERPDVTVLAGNHDCVYAEVHAYVLAHRHKRPLLHGCSGFTHSKAIEFAKEVTLDHWRKVRLFCVVHGWLLSHAGIRENFWHANLTDDENLGHLWRQAGEALDQVPFKVHPLLECGFSRGGSADHGGCTWLDWDTEFEDNLPLPQIAGHTHRFDLHRRIGRSWCIDSGVGYVLIRGDGSVEHKTLRREKVVDKDLNPVMGEYHWVPGVPQFRDDTEHAAARRYSVNPNLLSP